MELAIVDKDLSLSFSLSQQNNAVRELYKSSRFIVKWFKLCLYL